MSRPRKAGVRIGIILALAPIVAMVPSDAMAATAPQAGNLLVSSGATVFEYTPSGDEVQQLRAPVHEYGLRDLVVDDSGSLRTYNGTFDPMLTSYDFQTGQWTHDTHPGWSTVNVIYYGGLAVSGHYAFATDMTTYGEPLDELAGIVRFNLMDGSSVRFADDTEFTDLNMGLDGFLYGLDDESGMVKVFDPSSIALHRTLRLSHPAISIAVDQSGHIYAGSWTGEIRRFDPAGRAVATLPTGLAGIGDIDVSADGKVAATERFSRVLLSDTSLSGFSSFLIGDWGDPFVTFVPGVAKPVPPCPSDAPTIVGTPESDFLAGTRGPDVIHGLGGDDFIFGFEGEDIICGGEGGDDIDGGRAADTVFGDEDDDRLSGGDGDDRIFGGAGEDGMTGGSGNDDLDGRDGGLPDMFDGGRGLGDMCRVDASDSVANCER